LQLDELGSLLSNLCNLVPDGIVVFFPSYNFLEKVKAAWERTGLLAKLKAKKSVRLSFSVCPSRTFLLSVSTESLLCRGL
jgi:hypothetical protein